MPTQNPRRSVALLAAATFCGVITLTPMAAQAATPTATGQSCWHDIDTGASECFVTGSASPAEAIADATGTTVVAVPTGLGSASASAPAPLAPGAGRAAAVTYLLTVLYDGTNKTGDSSSYFTMNANICNGIINQFPSLPTFNDRAESLTSYNGCRTTLWHDNSFGGSQYGPVSSSTTLGSFNNAASSMIVTD